jgi:lactate permease
MDFLFAVSPILLLIWMLTKPRAMASHVALPLVAVLLWIVKLFVFDTPMDAAGATVILGVLESLTPITIIWGAIFLFKTMELSGSMDVVRRWLNEITDNRTAQLMIIGWAFSFLIEGASGFGTPAALAAPLLVGLGFPPVRVAMLALVMNSVPVSFGAVGTPTWFGLGQLGLSEAEMLTIGFKTAVFHGVAALFVPILALRFVISWDEIRGNLGFVFLSILGCVIPYVALARYNYEFPALFGGAVGLGLSAFLAHAGIGLKASAADRPHRSVAHGQLFKALFPIWGTLLILLITRIQQLGIKGLLNRTDPAWTASLGPLGDLSVSPALVISVRDVLGVAGADGSWSYKALYVPALIPFFLVSALAFAIYRVDRGVIARVCRESWQRMVHPIIALMGALVMVRLLMSGGEASLVQIIGRGFAAAAGGAWIVFAPFLGAVGSFFSGSATISNLTFGGIQASIADSLGLDRSTILALQSVGGAMGNMVCINNIVAVCSILGLSRQEGYIIKRTVVPLLFYGAAAVLVALVLGGR